MSRLLSCRYTGTYHQPLPLSLTPRTIGTKCCGVHCCKQGYECSNGDCVSVVSVFDGLCVVSTAHCFQISLSVASVKSVEAERSKSSELAANTAATYDNGSSSGSGSGSVALVGGVVGGVLGVTVLVLLIILLWRRKRGAPAPPLATQQQFFAQQPSPQLISPVSPAFSAKSSYHGGVPVTYAPQTGWHSQRSTLFALPGGAGSHAASPPGSAPPAYAYFIPPVSV